MATLKRHYRITQILDEFDKQSKDKKIAILFSAIDIMQQYNGRSRSYCIAMAMGYDNFEGSSDTFFKS